jgi:microcystin-dependent protein
MSTKQYPYLGSYSPAANDRVLLMPVGTTYMIVGVVSTGTDAGLPAGSVQAYAGAAAPTGWLLCDGSAVSRSTYARLFVAIGTTWGVGDGSTTFNLPDLRGRVPVGAGAGAGLTARTLAETSGTETHTGVTAHTHAGPSHTHTGPSHTHSGPSHTHSVSSHTHSGPSHTHGFSGSVSGTSGGPSSTEMAFSVAEHTSVPDPAVVRVGVGPDAYMRTPYTSGSGITNHTHSFSDSFSGDTGSGGTGSTGSGGSGDTGSGGTGATGAGGTGASGASGTDATGSTGAATVDHMPPFRGITYMIKV